MKNWVLAGSIIICLRAVAFDALVYNFEDNQPVGVKIAEGGGLGRPCMVSDSDTPGVVVKLKKPVVGDFAFAAWIWMDEYPAGGKEVFNAKSPYTLAHLKGESDVFLRVYGKKLSFVLAKAAKWRAISSRDVLPLGKWVFVAVRWVDNQGELYVDGRLQATARDTAVKPAFDEMIIARNGDRRFIGKIDEVRLYNGDPGPDIFQQLFVSRANESRQSFLQNHANSRGDWSPAVKEVPYRCLKVQNDVLHPLAEGVAARAEVLPWNSENESDLLIGGIPTFFGGRVTIHHPVGADERGLPVYSAGDGVPLEGRGFRSIPRKDGLFDLLAYGEGTPLGRHSLIYYRNIGSPGNPCFDSPEMVQVGFDELSRALGMLPTGWTVHDFNGDGVVDLLVAGGSGFGPNNMYWPDGVNIHHDVANENSGPGRGYDIQGNWLGIEGRTKLFWIPGALDAGGRLMFRETHEVYLGDIDYQVQWRFYGPDLVPGVVSVQGADYILLAGSVDELVALPFVFKDGEIRCQSARPLLKDGYSLKEMYWTDSISTGDLDGDGADEVVVSGNPGRVVVLRGSEIGQFEEVGSVSVEGGEVQTDTLVTPARGLWDNDTYPDLICGDASGWLTYWPGTSDPTVYGKPTFLQTEDGKKIHHQAGPTGSMQGPNEARWGYLQPSLGDWDNDGRVDLLVNDICSDMILYRRSGSPQVVERVPFTFNGKKLPVAWRARPAVLPGLYKYAGDDRPVLLYMDWDGDVALGVPTTTGSTEIERSEKLYYADGESVHLCGIRGHWGRVKLSLADWDGDGRWDIVWGQNAGTHRYIWKENPPKGATPCWLRNVGTNQDPVFERVRLIRLADGTQIDFKTHNASVWPTDLNQNGRLDLLVGAEDGKVYYFYREELEDPSAK